MGQLIAFFYDGFKHATRCSKILPHALTIVQEQNRVHITHNLLSLYEKERESFINRVVAIDQTRIRSYEPELKRQSSGDPRI